MGILDSRDGIAKVDPNHGLQAIEQLGSQVQQLWEQSRSIEFPDSYKQATNVVVAGMGGSAYGTHVIQTLFKEQLKVPVTVIPDYTLPAYVNEQTVVILSSYSGTSEETLSAAQDALKKGAQITGLTTGGPLAEFLTSHNFPSLIFDPEFNPSKVARFGYGYSLFGQMVLFERLGLITLTEEDYKSVLMGIANAHMLWSVNVPQDNNQAKIVAYDCVDRIPVITVAEFLEGMAHVVANAFNENAKTFSEYRIVPEMNHHLLEGFQFPRQNDNSLLMILARSSLFSEPNQKRMELTSQLGEKFHIEVREVTLSSSTALEQAWEYLLFGLYVAYYLAIIYNQDPTVTPQVDWLKSQLQKG